MHISIMIPVYNRASLLGFTIQSALNQTFIDFNIVVVDDASTDETVQIAQEYCKDKRITIIRNKQNLGLTKNWNSCLELAKGPLVQILQSDDLLDYDYLERVNQIFEENPEIGFVSATCRSINHLKITSK